MKLLNLYVLRWCALLIQILTLEPNLEQTERKIARLIQGKGQLRLLKAKEQIVRTSQCRLMSKEAIENPRKPKKMMTKSFQT